MKKKACEYEMFSSCEYVSMVMRVSHQICTMRVSFLASLGQFLRVLNVTCCLRVSTSDMDPASFVSHLGKVAIVSL